MNFPPPTNENRRDDTYHLREAVQTIGATSVDRADTTPKAKVSKGTMAHDLMTRHNQDNQEHTFHPACDYDSDNCRTSAAVL
jgi:hypothetical protein